MPKGLCWIVERENVTDVYLTDHGNGTRVPFRRFPNAKMAIGFRDWYNERVHARALWLSQRLDFTATVMARRGGDTPSRQGAKRR